MTLEAGNKIWTFRYSAGFVGFDKLIYGLATCRRWIRTYKNSKNKDILKECFMRGVKDGFGKYKPTREIFENTSVAEQVDLIELPLGR